MCWFLGLDAGGEVPQHREQYVPIIFNTSFFQHTIFFSRSDFETYCRVIMKFVLECITDMLSRFSSINPQQTRLVSTYYYLNFPAKNKNLLVSQIIWSTAFQCFRATRNRDSGLRRTNRQQQQPLLLLLVCIAIRNSLNTWISQPIFWAPRTPKPQRALPGVREFEHCYAVDRLSLKKHTARSITESERSHGGTARELAKHSLMVRQFSTRMSAHSRGRVEQTKLRLPAKQGTHAGRRNRRALCVNWGWKRGRGRKNISPGSSCRLRDLARGGARRVGRRRDDASPRRGARRAAARRQGRVVVVRRGGRVGGGRQRLEPRHETRVYDKDWATGARPGSATGYEYHSLHPTNLLFYFDGGCYLSAKYKSYVLYFCRTSHWLQLVCSSKQKIFF
jgi:hypothetical protein